MLHCIVYSTANKMPQDKMPQFGHGQNATKRKPDKMLQNKNTSNNKSYNSVTKA